MPSNMPTICIHHQDDQDHEDDDDDGDDGDDDDGDDVDGDGVKCTLELLSLRLSLSAPSKYILGSQDFP